MWWVVVDFFFFFYFFRSLSLCLILSLSLSLSLSCHYLSLSLVHSPCSIPFMMTHLVMTESLSASTIIPSLSLLTLASTKKKVISIRYSRMRWKDSNGGVIEEIVVGEHKE